MKKTIMMLSLVGIFLASCAPTYNPSTISDDLLTCDEIRAEIARAESIKNEAQGNKGFSAQNIGWALLFWPAIFLNESNNSQVIAKADSRIQTLQVYYRQKNCAQQNKPADQPAQQNPETTPPAQP